MLKIPRRHSVPQIYPVARRSKGALTQGETISTMRASVKTGLSRRLRNW